MFPEKLQSKPKTCFKYKSFLSQTKNYTVTTINVCSTLFKQQNSAM